MELCYDGNLALALPKNSVPSYGGNLALVLPRNAVAIMPEEMEYIDGGVAAPGLGIHGAITGKQGKVTKRTVYVTSDTMAASLAVCAAGTALVPGGATVASGFALGSALVWLAGTLGFKGAHVPVKDPVFA